MKAGMSFSGKMRAGWTKKQLMEYYALTEAQYERVLESLDAIRQEGV